MIRIILLIVLALFFGTRGAHCDEDPKIRYWTTEWDFAEIDLADVVKKLEMFGIELPFTVSGYANVELDVSVPLNALRTPKAYRVKGVISGTAVRLDKLKLDSLRTNVDLENGVLKVSNLRMNRDRGVISGNASAELIPRGQFDAKLDVNDFEIRELADLVGQLATIPNNTSVAGILSLKCRAQGDVNNLIRPARWRASGDAELSNLQVNKGKAAGDHFDVRVSGFQLAENQLQLSQFKVQSREHSNFVAIATASLPTDGDGEIRIAGRVNDFDLTHAIPLVSTDSVTPIDGKIDCITEFVATLKSGSLQTPVYRMQIASPNLIVSGVDLGLLEHEIEFREDHFRMQPIGGEPSPSMKIDRLACSVDTDQNHLSLNKLDGVLFGGIVRGDVSLAIAGNKDHRFDLQLANVTPSFQVSIPVSKRRLEIQGRLTGDVHWNVLEGKLSVPGAHRGDANLSFDDLKLATHPSVTWRSTHPQTQNRSRSPGRAPYFLATFDSNPNQRSVTN